MKREIKFRGKRVDNGEWVYGYYLISGKEHHAGIRNIIAVDEGSSVRYAGLDFYEVIPETVGQYTGLKDKDGKEIYEGDMVTLDTFNPPMYEIDFIEGAFCLTNILCLPIDIHYIQHAGINQSEVVGNIHDNPELLNQKEAK